jgi:hypothetical protein
MALANGRTAIGTCCEYLAHVTPAMPPTPRPTRHGRRRRGIGAHKCGAMPKQVLACRQNECASLRKVPAAQAYPRSMCPRPCE